MAVRSPVKYEVADIFRKHLKEYEQVHKLSYEQAPGNAGDHELPDTGIGWRIE